MKKTYKNPVLPGFHPDPSIVRVNEDYYMVNSTFEYFPAILISHSRDLVHWRYIGHAVTDNRHMDLSDVGNSCGVWAPDISYHNGTFYIFYPFVNMVNGQFSCDTYVVKAKNPAGPYSAPVKIVTQGCHIDPSHFVDDDGSHYLILNHAAMAYRLDNECEHVVDGPWKLWEGTGGISPEGPHVFRKDGFYYILLAEGGTSYDHCVTVARARHFLGPYEPCPYNPVLRQNDPEAAIQKAGHGKLVETQNGEWWMVHLGGRKVNGKAYCPLGRETCLQPVQWREDGWFVVNELKGPAAEYTMPDLPVTSFEVPRSDDFNEERLGLQWHFVRNPAPDAWSVTERPGWLRVRTGENCPGSTFARNAVLQREGHHAYEAWTRMEFEPQADHLEAGLTCFYNTNCFIKLFMTMERGTRIIRLEECRQGQSCLLGEMEAPEGTGLFLKVQVDKQIRRFLIRGEHSEWRLVGAVGDALFLSDEGAGIWGFTGTMVGVYAGHGVSEVMDVADFDSFYYQEMEAVVSNENG